MKALILITLIFSAVPSFGTSLECRSYEKVDGWNAVETHDYVYFKASIVSETQLRDAVIEGAYVTDRRDLKKDIKFKPRLEKYQDYHRYEVLEDAWCWFSPVLPRGIFNLQSGSRFTGFLHVLCEGGRRHPIAMGCRLQ